MKNHSCLKVGAFGAAAVVAFTCAFGASRTWTGGGDGTSWKDGANWGGTAPAAGDDVTVSATSVNDLGTVAEPLALHSLTLSGAITISGNPVKLANSGFLRLASASEAKITAPLVMGTAQTPAVTNSVADGGTLNLEGVISGPANIWVACDALGGKINLKAQNTFDGNLIIRQGAVFAYTDGAFGSTAGITDMQEQTGGRTARLWFMGITTYENFNFKTYMQGDAVYFYANTTNKFYGTIGGNNVHETWRAQSNAYVEFNNAVTNIACFTSNAEAGSIVKFNAPTSWNNTWYLGATGSSHIWMNDVWTTSDGSYNIRVAGGIYHLNQENVLRCSVSGRLYPHIWFAASTTIDMCGFDQSFTYIWNKSDETGSVITSEDPATMHLTCLTSTYGNQLLANYYGKFTGAVSLSLEGPKKMVFHNASTATGALSLTNGNTTAFEGSGSWAGNVVNVSGGSTLQLSGMNLSTRATLSVWEENSAVDIPDGVVQQVGALFLDGVGKAPGYYGSAESGVDAEHQSVHFTGKGRVWVRDYSTGEVSATWTGNGSGDSVATDENWLGDSAPNLVSGFTTATFAQSGSRAEVSDAATFKGVVFDAPGNFTIASAGGAGSVGVGSGGIRATAAAAREYSVEAPALMTEPQTWNVTNSATLRMGAVSGMSGATVKRVGNGTLRLDGPLNMHGGTFDIGGTGSNYLRDGASLGAAGDTVILRGDSGKTSRIYATNSVVVAANVTMMGQHQNSLFQFANNTTNRITGFVDFGGPSFSGDSGTVLALEGGITVTGWFWVRGANGFHLVIKDKPITSCSTGIYEDSTGVHLVLAAPSNNIGGNVYVYSASWLELAAPWALAYPSAQIVLGRNAGNNVGTIDLGGYDQGFGGWGGYSVEPTSANTRCRVTSDGPGGMAHHRDGANKAIYYSFEKLAGYVKEGPYATTFKYPSTTSNSLVVTEGAVRFGDGERFKGSWLNVTNVTVTGGTLETGGSVTEGGKTYQTRLNPKADFYLSGGKLTIPDGAVQRCSFLYLKDGAGEWRKARLGCYCGTAGVPGTTHLTLLGETTGVLDVHGDGKGTLMLFK